MSLQPEPSIFCFGHIGRTQFATHRTHLGPTGMQEKVWRFVRHSHQLLDETAVGNAPIVFTSVDRGDNVEHRRWPIRQRTMTIEPGPRSLAARVCLTVKSIGQVMWPRFGLRSLLLLITIVSLLLGVGASARTQRLAVSDIERHGGYVLYDYEVPDENTEPDPIWALPNGDRGLLVDVHRSVHLVSFFDPFRFETAINDSIIEVLLRFSELRYLDMSNTGITDRGFLYLADMEELGIADVTGTRVSEAARRTFKNKRPSVEIRY